MSNLTSANICGFTVCPYGYTECQAGGCVAATALCDGAYNCVDHSDELACSKFVNCL